MNITAFTPEYRSEERDLNMSPEMVAAIFARYSRKGEGLEAILDVLEKTPREKFEETVWQFLDYGHASIGGLTGTIPVGVNQVSMLEPYLAFFLQPKQDGQETSTRYVEFKPEGLAKPEQFGIPARHHKEWHRVMLKGFDINKELTQRLDTLGRENPELTNIPENVPPKTRDRMLKNYGFDRARGTVPLAGLTNFGLVMTSREWAETIKYMDSFDLPESKQIGDEIRRKISEITPRLMKHSQATDRTKSFANDFLDRGASYLYENGVSTDNAKDEVLVDVHHPPKTGFINPHFSLQEELKKCFEGKTNRYDFAKGLAEKIKISVAWNNLSIAEARDMNRQRPCKKDTLLAPIGSYMPEESIEAMKEGDGQLFDEYKQFLQDRANLMMEIIDGENPRSYVGCLLLGDQTPYEIHTDAAHFAYVTELRTGLGAHARYADHTKQAYDEVIKQLPEIEPFIQLGTGEPE